jgi:DNA-binding NtrC family response regulator/CHASE2 domain-containing sensor protein
MTRLAVCAAVGAVACILAILLHGPLTGVDAQFASLGYALRGTADADSTVVLVYVDESSIATLGWPVRRNFYALMIKALTDLHVRAVGMEVMFEDENPAYAEYDALLAQVAGSAGNVVVSSYFDRLGDLPDNAAEGGHRSAPPAFPRVGGVELRGSGLHMPYPALLNAAAGVGHLNLVADASSPLFVATRDGVVPSFAVEVLRVYARAGRGDARYDGSSYTLETPPTSVPTGANGIVPLNFQGPLSSFASYPFLEVLRSYDAVRSGREGVVPVVSFKDKIVLIGVIAEGRSRFVSTPVDPLLPSLAMHATFLDNALRHRFPGGGGPALALLLLLAVGIGSAMAGILVRPPWHVVLAFGISLGVLLVSLLLFITFSFVLPAAGPFVAGTVAAVIALVLRHRTMEHRVLSLEAEKNAVLAQLRDREAKVAILERELTSRDDAAPEARTEELLQAIRGYKAEIRVLTSQAEDMERYEPQAEPGAIEIFEGIVHERNGAVKSAVEFVRKIAGSDAPVLILGESGTGKELVARAIHRLSGRAQGPFVAVNCGALAENLLESELFGHERGAFTGAVKDRLGRFELADGGTIFLDEIGEVSEGFQLKLLRVLQEGELERVGAMKTIKVNVRVVAATNKDLREEVRAKRYREDLYYRLNVLSVTLPPLRERPGDIPLLARHFLSRENSQMSMSRNVMDAFLHYRWPGNVRELESVVRRAVLLSSAERRTMVSTNDLGDEIAAAVRDAVPVEEQILDLVREKMFSRSAVTETADEVGGLNRGTVAEYLRGEFLTVFVACSYDVEAAVRRISLSTDAAVNDRVRKRLHEYLANIAEAIDASLPWQTARLGLKPKAKNLPQRYHVSLEQVGEAIFRGIWKPGK